MTMTASSRRTVATFTTCIVELRGGFELRLMLIHDKAGAPDKLIISTASAESHIWPLSAHNVTVEVEALPGLHGALGAILRDLQGVHE